MIETHAARPVVVVPARLASRRLPRKLLREVEGRPLICWTAERIAREVPEFDLWFAVDGDELASTLKASGYSVVLTDPNLPSGTDRIAAANEIIGAERVINVQADEPLVTRSQILSLSDALEREGASMSTLCHPFETEEDFRDPNQVKVVRDKEGFALYFSRATIPFAREADAGVFAPDFPAMRHLGLYAYTAEFLREFGGLPVGVLEKIEKLEQLRALEHGRRIAVGVTDDRSLGVDSPEDLERVVPELRKWKGGGDGP